MTPLKIVLPLPPNRANAREHWRVTLRKKSAYYTAATLHILNQTKPSQRHSGLPMKVSATLYVWAMMDDDNSVARLKWSLDALKLAGMIRDDKRPWCALSGIPVQVIDRKNQRVELTLERV